MSEHGSDLTPEDLEYFRNQLLELQDKLTGEVQELHEEARAAADATVASRLPLDDAENASDAYEQDLAFSFLESETDLLKLVRDALDRIESGEYGRCVITGEPIARERLEMVPYTPYSLETQRKIESGEINIDDEESS